MYESMTVEELLEAKEGENIQFKEAKNRFDFGEATVAPWQTAVVESWYLESPMHGRDKWWEAELSNSQSALARD